MRTFCAQKLRMAGVMSIQAACPVLVRIQEVFGVPVELWLAEAA